MTYLELVDEAARMLGEAMQGDPRTMTDAQLLAGCNRFTAKWTAIADDSIAQYLERVYAPTP